MSPPKSRKQRKSEASLSKKLGAIFVFLLCWSLLIGAGIWGAEYYLDRLKTEMITEVNTYNRAQMHTLQQNYEAQLSELQQSVSEQFSLIETEVKNLNELLIFTKDSSSTDQDQSNQLYTQLNQLEQQLQQLKQNLEVLE